MRMGAVKLFAVVTPASSQPANLGVGGEIFEKMQLEFAEAYNCKDIAAMAGFFNENGTRITPAGVFLGGAATRGELEKVSVEYRVLEYNSDRSISRLEGNMVFHARTYHSNSG